MRQKKHYEGLTDTEVLKSREQYGANVLTPREKEPLWKQFLEKFEDPLIIILLIAGFLSIAISCWEYWAFMLKMAQPFSSNQSVYSSLSSWLRRLLSSLN
ncbi:cation-transporting P-type ATPase [Prevotella melaninogenica]